MLKFVRNLIRKNSVNWYEVTYHIDGMNERYTEIMDGKSLAGLEYDPYFIIDKFEKIN
jgi:hypothetical protein